MVDGILCFSSDAEIECFGRSVVFKSFVFGRLGCNAGDCIKDGIRSKFAQ